MHLYKRLCPSVGPSVCRSVRHFFSNCEIQVNSSKFNKIRIWTHHCCCIHTQSRDEGKGVPPKILRTKYPKVCYITGFKRRPFKGNRSSMKPDVKIIWYVRVELSNFSKRYKRGCEYAIVLFYRKTVFILPSKLRINSAFSLLDIASKYNVRGYPSPSLL